MPHAEDPSHAVTVRPVLTMRESELLSGLAGASAGPRWLWPGQPGPRSPWAPCAHGCCLVVRPKAGVDPVAWLRFLVRELLAPQARASKERVARLGLPGGHVVEGRVLLDGAAGSRLLVASGRQVRVRRLDEKEGRGSS